MPIYRNSPFPMFLSKKLSEIGIPHAFTTCRGGVSKGDFDSLNVSTRRRDRNGLCDEYLNTVENFRRVTALVGAAPESSVCAHQVHQNRILCLDKSFAGMGILKSAERNEDADGLFLSASCREIGAVCVKSADCTPILFADAVSGDVCAVHSGWRGTVLDIPGEAVRAMIAKGSRPENIVAAIGPCIGVCCYEVSLDVYLAASEAYEKKGKALPEGIFVNRREADDGVKYHFNIAKMCQSLIELAGVPTGNTEILGLCTCCYGDEQGRMFFSHRGQGGFSGTFASVVAPKR